MVVVVDAERDDVRGEDTEETEDADTDTGDADTDTGDADMENLDAGFKGVDADTDAVVSIVHAEEGRDAVVVT